MKRLKCAICKRPIKNEEMTALIKGVERWEEAIAHRKCLPAYKRPAVVRLMT